MRRGTGYQWPVNAPMPVVSARRTSDFNLRAGRTVAEAAVRWSSRWREAGLSAYQGASLMGAHLRGNYSSAGKGVSFRKPVDIFVPVFIVAGNRVRTPMASCRISRLRLPETDTSSLSIAKTPFRAIS